MISSKLKITICSHDGKNYFGGPYEWVKRFGPALKKTGVEVSFLFFSDHQHKDSSTFNYLSELGFNCKLLPHHSFLQYKDTTEARVRWCLKEVKQNPPDIFIANSSIPALFAGKWIKASGIPVIGVLHTDDERFQWMQEEFLSASKEFSLSALVCVSKLLKDKVAIRNPFRVPVEVISCGTPVPSHLKPKCLSPLKLVYAGKLTEDAKQISLLTKAFCKVVREVKGVEAYIYGDGPAKEDVLAIIAQEGKDLPVYYKGFVSSADIQDRMTDKHIIVLLSDYEGLPIILMEAMACGLVPVCLSIRSGIPELVKDGETGLLVHDRDEDFISAIERLAEHAVLFHALSINARHFVTQHHSMEVVVKKWLTLCESLIQAASPKRSFSIPLKIKLPPVNKRLKGIDQRKPSLPRYVIRQIVRFRNLLKRL
ncbi:MAG: putative glycosyl transferase, group [Cytophagaceae bacterium]|jgi:glycosyltransferase involved in cell wall biosynthesis|nr:putative glycosyl transferase, group [Cytophagaceae bacterium]